MIKLGEEQQVTTPDGRVWTLARLELRVVRAWREYVTKQVGDPFATVERYLGKLADEHLLPLLKEAEGIKRQLTCFGMGCPLSQQYLGTEEGVGHLVGLLLKKRHPGHTEEDAFEVAQEVNRRLEETLAVAGGELPPNAGRPAPGEGSRAESTGGNCTVG